MKNKDFGKPLCRLITMVAICMLSLNAMAYDFSYTHQGKTLYYNITSSNTVAVTRYASGNNNYVSGDVVIPSSVTNNGTTYSVDSIGYYAFYGCSNLTSVTIPNSVTSIGEDAFRNCSSLTTLNFNAIDCGDFDWWNNQFYGCPISTINIGDSVQRIPAYFAYNKNSLTSITIPESVTSIGNSAFCGCSSLTSITTPNSVTSIGEGRFMSAAA